MGDKEESTQISQDDKKNNLNKILDIAKQEYNNFHQRIQMLDVKVGLLMAFYGIIYANIIDVENLKKILLDINVNKNINAYNIFSLHCNVFSCLIFIITMILLIYNLVSRNMRFFPIAIFDKEVTKYTEEDLTSNLLEKTYRETIEKNNEILNKKHKIFNISCILLIINIILVILIEILK